MISQTAEYALRAVIVLASHSEGPMTVPRIAARGRVSAGYLAKVLQELARAGLVVAQRGPRGGFILARSRDELSVLDVVNAVDPLKRIERCPLGLPEHASRLCPLHESLDQGTALVEAHFARITIGALLAAPNPSRPLGDMGNDLTEPDTRFEDGVCSGLLPKAVPTSGS